MVFLAGLPRTGSTLLSSLLNQNPLIRSEGASALCQYMWDIHINQQNYSNTIIASHRENVTFDIIKALPHLYYKYSSNNIVVDKCRAWNSPANLSMIKTYITPNPKIIVLERPLIEVVASFVQLRKNNGWQGELEEGLLTEFTEPIRMPFKALNWAKENNNGEFIFISYNELILDTMNTLKRIYNFCEWNWFEPSFENIVNKYPEQDIVSGLLGMHDVRPNINLKLNEVEISEDSKKLCNLLEMGVIV